MLSPDEMHAPRGMIAEIVSLCEQARRGSGLYGQLLRENVVDVLRCSFPLFGARLEPQWLEEAAGAFLAGHPASRPQFHQIATEFVEFAQQQLDLSPLLLALLEYEWVLLATEIDPARVVPSLAPEDASMTAASR